MRRNSGGHRSMRPSTLSSRTSIRRNPQNTRDSLLSNIETITRVKGDDEKTQIHKLISDNFDGDYQKMNDLLRRRYPEVI